MLLKTLSHSTDIAGIARVSKAQRCSVGKLILELFHQSMGLNVFRSLTDLDIELYLANLSRLSFNKPIILRRNVLLKSLLNEFLSRYGKYSNIYTSRYFAFIIDIQLFRRPV
jgi:hypothetical protein